MFAEVTVQQQQPGTDVLSVGSAIEAQPAVPNEIDDSADYVALLLSGSRMSVDSHIVW